MHVTCKLVNTPTNRHSYAWMHVCIKAHAHSHDTCSLITGLFWQGGLLDGVRPAEWRDIRVRTRRHLHLRANISSGKFTDVCTPTHAPARIHEHTYTTAQTCMHSQTKTQTQTQTKLRFIHTTTTLCQITPPCGVPHDRARDGVHQIRHNRALNYAYSTKIAHTY